MLRSILKPSRIAAILLVSVTACALIIVAQERGEFRRGEQQGQGRRGEFGGEGPGGFRGQGGPGGPGGRMGRGFPPMPLMTAIDKNADGELSEEEIKAASAAILSLDKDKDGKISAEELRPAFGPGGIGGQGGPGGPGGPGGFGGRDMSGELVNQLMANDKNNDGKLTEDELPQRLKALMARADTNKDGVLDRAELTQYARQQSGGAEGQRGEREKREGRGEREKGEGRRGPDA